MTDLPGMAIVREALSGTRWTLDDVRGRQQHNQLFSIRHQIMRDLRGIGWSFIKIGQFMHRDHSTVHAALKREMVDMKIVETLIDEVMAHYNFDRELLFEKSQSGPSPVNRARAVIIARMHDELNMTYAQIGKIFGREEKAMQKASFRHRKNSKEQNFGSYWTKEQDDILLASIDFITAAKALGRSSAACSKRYYQIRDKEELEIEPKEILPTKDELFVIALIKEGYRLRIKEVVDYALRNGTLKKIMEAA